MFLFEVLLEVRDELDPSLLAPDRCRILDSMSVCSIAGVSIEEDLMLDRT